MNIYYKKLTPNASVPVKGTPKSTGWDLRTNVTSTLFSSARKISTGLAVLLPPGIWLKIFDRSSLAMRNAIILAGVIDNDYHGEIQVVMATLSNVIVFEEGDKIAQMVPMLDLSVGVKIDLEHSEFWGDQEDGIQWLEATEDQWALHTGESKRGDGGFGSTGR